MDDEVFASIIKYLDQGIMPKDKDSKESQAQWLKTVEKYQLNEETLVLRNQPTRRIISRSQYYPLMYTFYNDPTAGHLGYKKVLQKLSERYYWTGMDKDVNQYIAACYQCQMKKLIQRINELHPIPLSRLFDRWEVDVVGPLLITPKGNRYIIVAVEYLSKWQEAKAVSEANALSISNFLYQNIICRFGCFTHLHTNRGIEFVNEIVERLTEKFRAKMAIKRVQQSMKNAYPVKSTMLRLFLLFKDVKSLYFSYSIVNFTALNLQGITLLHLLTTRVGLLLKSVRLFLLLGLHNL